MKPGIQLIAQMKASEGRGNEFRKFLHDLGRLLLGEPGCRSCQLYESDQPGTFFALETWESREFLDLHFQSAQFERTQHVFKTLLSEPVQIHYLVELNS
jgi:quinol monooxygenase YgiN